MACEGYPDRRAERVTAPRERPVRQILPRDYQNHCSRLVNEPSRQGYFQNDLDWRYFCHFYDYTTNSLTGPIRTNLWSRSIPQAGEVEQWIREMTIALGALAMSQLKSSENSHLHQKQQHKAYAFVKYAKALQHMQSAICQRQGDTRQILLICVLVFCFEAMQGRQQVACQNAASGLRAVYEMLAATPSNDTSRKTRTRNYLESIDEDLACAEACLDAQLVQFIDPRSELEHRRFLDQLNPVIKTMPQSFETIKEAMSFWTAVGRRNAHFVTYACAQMTSLSPPEVVDDDNLTAFRVGDNTWSSAEPISSRNIPPELFKDHSIHLAEVANFRKASAGVMSREVHQTERDLSRRQDLIDFYHCFMLRIQMSASEIHLRSCFNPSQMFFDSTRDLFQDIVQAAPKILPLLIRNQASNVRQNPFTFRFLVSILPSLAAVTYFCRFQPERDQALAMLKQIHVEANDYMEGIWDIKVLYPHAQRMRDLEEEERDPITGQIPEEKRLCFADADVNIPERTVIWRWWQGVGDGRKLISYHYEW